MKKINLKEKIKFLRNKRTLFFFPRVVKTDLANSKV